MVFNLSLANIKSFTAKLINLALKLSKDYIFIQNYLKGYLAFGVFRTVTWKSIILGYVEKSRIEVGTFNTILWK